MSKITLPPSPRTIKIVPKHSGAATQYYEMNVEDEAYIYDWMIKFLADITEIASHNAELMNNFFNRNRDFPKGRNGPNSFASMLAGVISAKLHNPKHNISAPLLDPIETIFDVLVEYYKDLPNAPERIKFKPNLFE